MSLADRFAELVRLDAIDAATWPKRIARALDQLNHACSPLHARDHDAPANTSYESRELAETFEMQLAGEARKRLRVAIVERDRHARTVRAILDEWAPQAVADNIALWCPNHLKHGHHEPRGAEGTRHCGWCCDVKRAYGDYPTGKLIKLHGEGRRITEDEYRRHFGKGAA